MKKMKKGFTIVELVIVIGVIAILSAVLIPTFTTLSSKAKKSNALQEATDAYTQYLIAKDGDAKSQSEVVIVNGTYQFKYTVGTGWVDAENADKTDTQLFDTGNNDGHADSGEIVIYQRVSA